MSEQSTNSSPTLANFWAGVVMALLGLVAVFWLIPEFVTGANDSSKNLTPGFMPRVAAWCMVLLGFSVALVALRVVLGKEIAIAEESEENEALAFGRNEVINSFYIAILAIIYVFLLSWLGFIVPSTFLLMFLIYLTGYRNKIILLLIATLLPVSLELLLWHVLKVPLPQFPLVNF